MKKLTIFLLTMAATFALHAQGVNDSVKNKASRGFTGEVLVFYSEDNCEWDNTDNWHLDTPDGGTPCEPGPAPEPGQPPQPGPPRLPNSDDSVVIYSKCNLYDFNETEPLPFHSLTIVDGAQLRVPDGKMTPIMATVKKRIKPYELHIGGEPEGWHLISSPVFVPQGVQYEPDTSVFCNYEGAGLLFGNRDFYMFNQDYPGAEWRNYKVYAANNETIRHFVAEYNGYLYAHSEDIILYPKNKHEFEEDTTLRFYGRLYTDVSGQKKYTNLHYNPAANEGAKGVNLVGNPYACNARVQGVHIDRYFMMNDDGTDVVVIDQSVDKVIAPMTALFVVAEEPQPHDSASVTFTPIEFDENIEANIRGNVVEGLTIELTANGVLKDRVYIKDGEGKNGGKISISQLSPKIYVPENDKKNAIAYKAEANVMPLCFTSGKDDIFTLNFDTKGVNCSYLHLIDNVTGADIDLLAATSTGSVASYTFDSKDSHYSSRFKIVFNEDATNEILDNFAYISNGELIINGTGTLQVMDMTGRVIVCTDARPCVSTQGMTPGVYVVRLCNGNDVKTQKIVIR